MKTLIIVNLTFLSMILVSCNNTSTTTVENTPENQEYIAKKADVEQYLTVTDYSQTKTITDINEQIDFWQNKLNNDETSHVHRVKLASLLSERFKLQSTLEDIYASDSLLHEALEISATGKAGIYHSLHSNSITQHKFQDAHKYADLALQTNESPEVSNLLMIDALLELGETEKASDVLISIENKSSFDYLIRESKIHDHYGNLDSAIASMETAYLLVANKSDKAMFCWAKSNLGDMYGHDGRVQDSYDAYMEVLAVNSDYLHALKGIAWIAYSRDKNTAFAKEIYQYVYDLKGSPDILLSLAEISEYEGKEEESERMMMDFKADVENTGYQKMYGKYYCLASIEAWNDLATATSIASEEIAERPNAQSYDLLAWAYYNNGELTKAYDIASNHVEGKSFEPEIIFHLGCIYKALGNDDKAEEFLNEALDASYELGPMTEMKIKEVMTS